MYYDKDGDLKPGKKGKNFANIKLYIAENNFTIRKNKYTKGFVNKIFHYLYCFYRNMLNFATMAKVYGCCGRGG